MPDATSLGTLDAMHVCNEIAESSGKPTQYLFNVAYRKAPG